MNNINPPNTAVATVRGFSIILIELAKCPGTLVQYEIKKGRHCHCHSTKNKMAVFTVLLEVLGVLAVSQTTIDPDDGEPSLKIEAA